MSKKNDNVKTIFFLPPDVIQELNDLTEEMCDKLQTKIYKSNIVELSLAVLIADYAAHPNNSIIVEQLKNFKTRRINDNQKL